MIVVIADDLTGAAELGGIGLRYGLIPQVQAGLRPPADDPSLLLLDTDTRSLSADQAGAQLTRTAALLRDLRPEGVYKKVDSVLRGHPRLEIETLLTETSYDRSLLIPANPSLGRTIRDGRYFVHGIPLHETDFSRDPEYPVHSSRLLDLLGSSGRYETCVLSEPQFPPRNCIAVGEASSRSDLLTWASCLTPEALPAGGAEFFAAILEEQWGYHAAPAAFAIPSEHPTLFVCGSSSETSRQSVEYAARQGIPVVQMPVELFGSQDLLPDALAHWLGETVDAFGRSPRVIITLHQLEGAHPICPASPLALRQHTAEMLHALLGKVAIRELYAEGGATAAAIVHREGWIAFFPRQELAPGVVRMRVAGSQSLHFTIKPGSYAWPAGLFD